MAIDPVCGMKVNEEAAKNVSEFAGSKYFFCGAGCKRKFDADPDSYLKAARQPAVHSDHARKHVHTAPSAKAGAAAANGDTYTCPMHPEVRQTGPGICPKCGMALEPVYAAEGDANPELAGMTRRFWTGCALTVPILGFMVSELLPGDPLTHALGMKASRWIQFALA